MKQQADINTNDQDKAIDEANAPTLSNALPNAILDHVNIPADMKGLTDEQLKQLSSEVRQATIEAVAKTGGHLGAGLGVVELTVAIHAVFDTPQDKLVWDVGHQCYPHKILTGRKDRIDTLRKGGGLSGFTKRSESEYDPFGAGHSSTSISAALGMAAGRDINGDNTHMIAVIGDGSMSAGMAYEALNNAGDMKSRLIVILNDNEMSIAPPVGAMSKHLTKMVSSKGYRNVRDMGKKITEALPSPIRHAAKRAEEGARVAIGGGSLFEEMGFYYIGPVDGHDLDQLLPILRNLKNSPNHGPVLIHARTQKGKGYLPAENSTDKMHGVKKFDVITGQQAKSAPSAPSYTGVFAEQLIKQAEKDEKIVAITAAMPSGTGLDKFASKFPDRCFDVGIAEQHAVTFAAGLASEGLKPFCALYSTFLQRGYDQLVHDVAIQNLPVRFMIDRAGLVGADGATHAGSFDIAYLACLPNMTLMAASDESELAYMVDFAAKYNDGPLALRYPRGNGLGLEISAETSGQITLGKGRVVHGDANAKGDIAILSYGTRLQESLKAAKMLEEKGLSVTVADARFAKPLDEALTRSLAQNNKTLITLEEGSRGGFGSIILEYLANNDLLSDLKIRTLTLPDYFQDHNDPEKQYEEAGLVAQNIIAQLK